jgi:hypothetical protein
MDMFAFEAFIVESERAVISGHGHENQQHRGMSSVKVKSTELDSDCLGLNPFHHSTPELEGGTYSEHKV